MKRSLLLGLVVVMLLVLPLPAYSATIVVDSINASFTPSSLTYGAVNAGWEYTPASSYTLNRIETMFSSVNGNTITVEVYDEPPALGGVLLASGTFTPTQANVFVGGDLNITLTFTGGEDYFIGLVNVFEMGANVTDQPGATGLPYWSGAYDVLWPVGTTIGNYPILRFLYTEEPSETVAGEPVPGCDVLITIPDTAVGATITADTPVYWMPGEPTSETFPAGLTLRAIGVDASGAYTKVLYACGYYWVPTGVIGPNYDEVWNGAPLPTGVVE